MLSGYSIPRPALNASGSAEAGWDVSLSTGGGGINVICSGQWSNAVCYLLIAYTDK